MKTIDEYMKLEYRIETKEDLDEGGYIAFFPDLPGCITYGDTKEEALANAQDAKRAWLEAAIECGINIDKPDDLSSSVEETLYLKSNELNNKHLKNSVEEFNNFTLKMINKE